MLSALARWLRGALGVGVTWSVLWVMVGLLLWGVIRAVSPEDIGPDEGLRVAIPILGLVGFLSGLGFAGLLSVTERRHSLRDLSLPRIALWGFLGSAAIPYLIGAKPGEGWLTGVLGATFAVASVALARRGTGRPPELSDGAARALPDTSGAEITGARTANRDSDEAVHATELRR